nr:YkvA family protein [Pseudomonas caspiana]
MVLWFCYQHPQTPWLPKWISAFVVAYVLSPIDLIPDFIPVLGYLDDVIILPRGVLLAIRLMPSHVLEACQLKASGGEKPCETPREQSRGGAHRIDLARRCCGCVVGLHLLSTNRYFSLYRPSIWRDLHDANGLCQRIRGLVPLIRSALTSASVC